MLHLELSEKQRERLLVLLDKELKTNGLVSLVEIVDLFNLLQSAKSLDKNEEVPSTPEPV